MSPNLGVGGRLEGRFFFQAIFSVHSGLSSVHLNTGLSMQLLSWGGGGFFFLSGNGKAQGASLLFLLSLEGGKDFFFILPCFPMCPHGVPSTFLMGSPYVPQVHNVFPNMFSI
jgi:hypothetical protein